MANAAAPVSILFNAAALATGQFAQPFQAQIQGQDPITAAASSVDIVTLDATLEELHNYSAEVTEHPVEQGADITDHVRPKPIEVRMRGVVSNTPLNNDLSNAAPNAAAALGIAVAPSAQSLLGAADFSELTFATLTKLSQSGSPCILYTKYTTYSSMVMTSLEITRDQHTGAALAFAATFRQITTVESANATVTLPAMAQAATDSGTQGTTTASASVTHSALFGVTAQQGNAAAAALRAAGAPMPFSGNIP